MARDMEKKCSRCSAKFECLGNDSCWCFKVELDGKDSEALRGCYDDCLCESCLKSAGN